MSVNDVKFVSFFFSFLILAYIYNNMHFIYKSNDEVLNELHIRALLTNCRIDAATDRMNFITLN